nr:MAG TPA: hypothetical protein [Caudoviricetes sp.]DAN81604.1 MAG TPA: hypothetical protein [Caudoviricetes sp.]DAS16766.1 MAG TPA: hypothetical protein [Caudoviricetes sp.]
MHFEIACDSGIRVKERGASEMRLPGLTVACQDRL